ncbi:hypothetical protein JTE90_019102 [Oedothorax gibbosus]|uniref:Uncharacterized protein n=1 Tax=Oedothorax gibbosus TaxID=931172 RepID=A0AAV6V845_9ARAC|nr:hypothetical protein JTE90_019102 [Oedothorax gibbosus]
MPTCISLTLLLTLLASPRSCQAQFFASDAPGPISQLLQLVWEPSSLIRMWTALDQLYNVVLGWRAAARTVVELPFRQGRSMSHVKIQEPRSRYKSRQSWEVPHWDWFKKVYDEESYVHRTGSDLVAQHSSSDPVVDKNAPLGLHQGGDLGGISDADFQNLLNSMGAENAREKVPRNLQQSLNAFSNAHQHFINSANRDRNIPSRFQQSLNAFSKDNILSQLYDLRGNENDILNLKNSMNSQNGRLFAPLQQQLPIALRGDVPSNLQQSMNSMNGDFYNHPNLPGTETNRNVLQTFQQSINGLKEMFRDSLSTPLAGPLKQSMAILMSNFRSQPYSPGINPNDFLLLHQLQNIQAFQNSIQTDSSNRNSPKRTFPIHHPKFSDIINKNGDPRRIVKIPQSIDFEQSSQRPNNVNVPMMFFNANSVPNSNPETRLRMFLKLMETLGEMHKKNVKPVDFDDDVNDGQSDDLTDGEQVQNRD